MKTSVDPSVRDRVTDLLYAHLPSLYRIRDLAEGAHEAQKAEAPPGAEELYKFLRVLAAPLAAARQNIEELHADLFIDKSADWVLPYLAEMVGVRLVFPDAPSNRRDVRGTVAWRRRKGTPAMLEEMAGELSGHTVVLSEGWKRILLAQDLDLYRPERTIAELSKAVIAERASGPLDAAFHAVDPRRIGERTGKYHPKHITHWMHPTRLFPLREGAAFDRTFGAPLPDLRYSFHPLGADVPLRVQSSGQAEQGSSARPLHDRVLPMHFAADPGTYFDQAGTGTGGFTVRICGLPAGVAAPEAEARTPSDWAASPSLVSAQVDVLLLEHTAERLSSAVAVEVHAVELNLGVPNLATTKLRGGVTISAAGGTPIAGVGAAATAPFVAMLRVSAVAGGAYFPGAVIEIAGQAIDARLSAAVTSLATRGFLRGALVVRVPAMWVTSPKWLFLAADGSVRDWQAGSTDPVADGAGFRLPGDVLSLGPGPAWPPLPLTAEATPLPRPPSSAARGPVVVHGAPALVAVGPGFAVPPAMPAPVFGLVFAIKGRNEIHPFLRLDWTGPDPKSAATWTAFDASGNVVATEAALRQALAKAAEMTDTAAESGDSAELWVRLECDTADMVLPPCEVAFTSDRGDTVLVHLPQLAVGAPQITGWTRTLTHVSQAVSVSADGSTFEAGTRSVARFSCGPIAPIRQARTLRRRTVRQKPLCWWKNEDPMTPETGLATPEGFLDIDPHAGLFALAKLEPAPDFTVSALHAAIAAWPPASVTVDYQEGYSHHTGARPDAREPIIGAELPSPTRLVLRGGRFHPTAPSSYHTLPRYATLRAALDAIAADPDPADHEVIQIEDSVTYEETGLFWPGNIESLTIQAAELERPTIALGSAWTSGMPPAYEELVLRGLQLLQTREPGGVTTTYDIEFPPAAKVQVQLCTTAHARDRWVLASPAGAPASIEILRCVTGRLRLAGKGTLTITDSVVDAAGGEAIFAPDGEVRTERVTVVADPDDIAPGAHATDVLVLEASETIFTRTARARDRFHGCVRYSRVEPGSLLPARHRVTEETPLFVSRDRNDAAHLRLSESCPRAVTRGAEDGSEMGAFHGARLAQHKEALLRRLIEYTPAGLATGLLRSD